MTSARVPRLTALTGVLAALGLVAGGCTAAGSHPTGGPASASVTVADAQFLVASGGPAEDHAALDALTWTRFDPAAAYLRGPHFALRVAGSATVGELTPELLTASGLYRVTLADGSPLPTGQPLRAATGQEFLLIRLTDAGFPHFHGVNPSYTLVVAGQPRAVREQYLSGGAVLVASVPAGSPVTLAVDDKQRVQSVDLRTGVAADRVPLEYPERGGKVDSLGDIFDPRITAAKADDGLPYFSVDVNATLLPWTEAKGWAPAGRGWLELVVQATLLIGCHVKLDLGRSLTIRAGGKAVPVSGTLDLKGTYLGSDSVTVAVDVPAGTTSLTVSLSTHATVTTTDGQPAAYVRYANKNSAATLTLAPVGKQG